MKKLLSTALVACFVLTLAVGCGDTGTTKKSTGATTSTGTGGTTKKEETKKEGDATPPKAESK
jgi:hypothetical protein